MTVCGFLKIWLRLVCFCSVVFSIFCFPCGFDVFV